MATEIQSLIRQLWHHVEPFHSVYLAPQANRRYDAAGLQGGWMRYFAARSSPLGAVPPEVVIATFYGFHPRLVGRSLPSAWERTTPQAVIEARVEAVDLAVRGTGWAKVIDHPGLGRAVELLRGASNRYSVAGRPLYAAHAALESPSDPHLALWWQATLLREYRGDGHVAALLAERVAPAESLVLHCATGELTREVLQPLRGWNDEEWETTTEALVSRGWLEPGGGITAAGRILREHVEAVTDDLAAEPWLKSTDGTSSLAEAVALTGDVLKQ